MALLGQRGMKNFRLQRNSKLTVILKLQTSFFKAFHRICLVVPMFDQGDDLIACLNKAMAFLTAIASSRFPSTNNQLKTSFNPRNQATIQDGRVTVKQVQGRQGQSFVGTGYKGNATSSRGNNAGGQERVVKCYNCQGEEHMARQCTQPKRPRNAVWFKEKAMLAEAQESGQILDEEQLAFLADPGIPDGQAAQTTIPNTTSFQTEDLNAYDSDCDDVSNAKAVLMANLSNYASNVISEVPHFEPYHTDMDSQSVHAIQGFEQTPVVDFTNNEITSDGNIISQHAASLVIDDEETLILEELNRLFEDFGKHFVPQQELSDEQAFWLQTSHPNTNQSASSPVKIEAPRELPKITPNAITNGEWGFENTRAVFLKEIIPFLKTLTDIFNVFDKDLLNEVTEVQTVFNQMEATVQQCFVDKQCFEIHKKESFLENDRLLHQIKS
ncbi:phosphopantothenoylcysteine decarboxylase-like protein [Tanacetum coccineum]